MNTPAPTDPATAPPPCPCGRQRPYATCCGPLHRGEQRAASAEDLMRSRYAAYSLGEVDYLLRTSHPQKRTPRDRWALVSGQGRVQWVGLRILAVEGGSLFDATGVVEFEASYVAGGKPGVMHERSRFAREDGAWYYADGDVS